MKNINPYPSYKPSGIAWLGDIPQHWEVRKLKFVADCFPSNVDKHSKQDEKSVRLCNYTDVYKNDYIKNTMQFMIATASDDQIEKFALKKGDVIITKDSETSNDIAVPALVNEDLDNVICGYHLSVLRPNKNLNGSFLFRTLLCKPINIQFEVCANGVTRVGLGVYDLKKAKIPVPSLEEQTAIAQFLDYKLHKIDRFIRKKKQLIALLNEQKAAIINEAVTKGLDPSVPMKPSGIEWLGNVPKHWEVRKLKYLVSKIGSGVTPSGGATVYKDSGVPFLRSQNVHFDGLRLEDVAFISQEIHDSMSSTALKPLDVVLNITGASLGRCCIIPIDFREGNVNQHVCIIRSTNLVDSYYLAANLSSSYIQKTIQSEQVGSSREGLNQNEIKNLPIILPPINEQKAIVTHIEQETAILNRTIATIEKEIALVQEYRTTLIAEAVTGKIDVRQFTMDNVEWTMEEEDLADEIGENTEGGDDE